MGRLVKSLRTGDIIKIGAITIRLQRAAGSSARMVIEAPDEMKIQTLPAQRVVVAEQVARPEELASITDDPRSKPLRLKSALRANKKDHV